ncbi:MAG TPA: 1-(5-phosphoribosyl)-5-[(5-phosphoribosylamino)methylideneamino] imidazole-4-carboxamide isomerase [Terriglobales bacterium]
MLIPSIDLMGGKIVQLVQGQKKALEFDDFDEWIERFSGFPLVQLIDLDAAIGTGDNRALIEGFTRRLPCQVGGGIRSVEVAQQILALGAKRVIIGSSLIHEGKPDAVFAEKLARIIGVEQLVFAVDAKGGKVAIRGWREGTALTPVGMIRAFDTWCHGYLYTHIDHEGLMKGIPFDVVRELRAATSKQLIAAGGISSNQEIDQLHSMGVDAVVGMALYLGKLDLSLFRHSGKNQVLRNVTYERYEYLGPRTQQDRATHSGSLLAFVYDIPYFDACGIFPPLHIVNQLFSLGTTGGGMSPGTSWQPFTISKDEYDLLVEAVKNTPISEITPYARYALRPLKFDHTFDDIPERTAWFQAVCQKHRNEWHAELEKFGLLS